MPFGTFSLFSLVFWLILIMIVVQLVRGVIQWGRNNASPRLTVEAIVTSTRRTLHYNATTHTGHPVYYATFEFESGDRMELKIPERDIGMLAEGDRGKLTFQGTRFLGFARM